MATEETKIYDNKLSKYKVVCLWFDSDLRRLTPHHLNSSGLRAEQCIYMGRANIPDQPIKKMKTIHFPHTTLTKQAILHCPSLRYLPCNFIPKSSFAKLKKRKNRKNWKFHNNDPRVIRWTQFRFTISFHNYVSQFRFTILFHNFVSQFRDRAPQAISAGV